MKDLKKYRQTLIRRAAGKGYKFAILRKKYGKVWVAKLVEHLEAELVKPGNFSNPPLPSVPDTTSLETRKDFYQAGVPLYEWKESFIDEDTGEPVDIDRHEYRLAVSISKPVAKKEKVFAYGEQGIEFGKGFVKVRW